MGGRGREKGKNGNGREVEAERPRQGELTRISLWACTTCGYNNWATRSRCNACTRRRMGSARVVEEWWHRARVPPEVMAAGASIHKETRTEVPHRRVPGLQATPPGPQPTGRRPTRFVEEKVGPPTEGGAKRRTDQQAEGGGGEEKRSGEEGSSWKDVVRRGKKRGRETGGKHTEAEREKDGGGEDKEKERGEGKEAAEEAMPPERVFLRPDLPREALAKRLERQEVREATLREQGAKARQLSRAAQKKQETAEKLKAAGGKTPLSLGLQIRKEEENKRKAIVGIERGESRIGELESEIQKLQKQVEAEKHLQERFRQRGKVEEDRLQWLAMQKGK